MSAWDVSLDYFKYLSGMALPGAFAMCVVAPIDRIKLLLQTQDVNHKILQRTDIKFKGIVDCFRRVLSEQGARSFWRGNLAGVARFSLEYITTVLIRDNVRELIPRYSPHRDKFWKFYLSKMAYRSLPAAIAHFITYPLDYAQLRLASDIGRGQRTFKGIVECITKTIQTGGVFSLYRGFTLSLVAVMQRRGIQFGSFDTVSAMNPFRNKRGVIGYISTFVVALVCAISAHFAVHPLETVYRRLQMESDFLKENRKYSGFFDCWYKIQSEETMAGFYKGAFTNAVLRTVSSSLVMLFYYEMKSHYPPER